MHRALWLLLGLRFKGWLRRLKRALTTVRGLLVTILGTMCLTSWLLSLVVFMPAATAEHLERVRELGPPILILICLLNYFMAAGERVLAFSPAEVNLLFPAPFTRRQLLLYKITGISAASLLLALFLAFALRQHTSGFITGLVGILLGVLFLQFFALAIALIISIVGARVYTRQRRVVLLVLAALALFLLWNHGLLATDRPPLEILAAVRHHPVAEVVLAPFIWQVNAVTADAIWPDLVVSASLCLLADAVLLAIVLALDAHYLEAAAAAGEKLYRRLERIRRGGMAGAGLATAEKARWTLPMPPRWGGIGPLAWRQLLSAVRNPWWMFTVAIFMVAFLTPMFLLSQKQEEKPPEAMMAALASMLFFAAMFLPALMAFDFRADVDRMELLKTLPLAGWKIVLGQLMVPITLLTLVQILMLAAIQLSLQAAEPKLWALVPFLASVNFLVFAVENLIFLWFPTRLVPATPGDMQNFGRVMLIWIAKLALVMVIMTVAALLAVPAYFLAGQSWVAAGVMAWIVITAFAGAALQLLCLAFSRFDVARDTPP